MKQAYLKSPLVDLVLITGPSFLAILVVLLFPNVFIHNSDIPSYFWLVLIVFIDVGHVYSTLFRSYFDSEMRKEHRVSFILVPVFSLIAGIVLFSFSSMLFWRIMAYLAVFHFIRQQYGFMRIYSRFEVQDKFKRLIDTLAIYSASIYPVLHWHLTDGRNFNWFVKGDFMHFNSSIAVQFFTVIYWVILGLYVWTEIRQSIKIKMFNVPKNLLLMGTYLSWYLGIVYFNSDLAFTTLNVVSHGIPYMVLVWLTAHQRMIKSENGFATLTKMTLKTYGIPLFIAFLMLLAYLEEGLWDGFVWRDHETVFAFFSRLPQITGPELLNILVPLLALPQITHYVLDGFIWKISKDEGFKSNAQRNTVNVPE